MRVAEVTSMVPTSVASHVSIPMEFETVYGNSGDRIKFALPGSTQDSDCWGASSQSFGSIEDTQTVTFEFDKVTHKGSFVLKSNGVNTVPIYVDDTELEAAIKMEQLPTIDKASVSIQRSGQYTVKFTITVLEPAGAQPDLEVVLPSDSSCRKCTSVTTCDNERFIYDNVNGILQIVNPDSACSFSNFELNREYVFSTASSSFAFVLTSYIFDGNNNGKSIVATAVDHTTFDFVATSIQTCPETDKCEAFAADVLAATVDHVTVGNGAVGEVSLSEDNKMTTNIVFTYNSAYINLGAPLCYKFGSAPWKIYPSLKIDLHSVVDVTPREIVAGQPTTVVVTGTPGSIQMNDLMRVLKSGDDCYNGDFASFIRNGVTVNTLLVQKDGEVEMTFVSDLEPSSSWTLCYQFANSNVFVHYSNIKFTVMSLKSMEATVPSMANNIIVANQNKWFTITGNSLTLYDVLFFVPYGQVCDPSLASNTAVSTNDKVLESSTMLKVRLIFPEPSVYSQVLCYHFANDLDSTKYYKFNDFAINVVDITSVTPMEGYAREPEMNYMFSGFWPLEYGLSDSVEWILESDPTVRVPGVVSRINLQSSCDVKFDVHGRYYLSYRFGQELTKAYPSITIYSLDVLSIRNQHAIVGCLYKPEMDIDYFRFMEESTDFDSVSFKVVGGSCMNSADSLPIDGKREELVNRAPVSGVSSSLATSEFLVKESQGGEYSLCYHWNNVKTIDYPTLTTFFHKFDGFTSSTEDSPVVLVGGVEKELVLSGSGIGEGDQIRLITPRNVDSPMCSYEVNRGDDECMAPFEDKTFTVTEDIKVSMQVDSIPSGSLQVCYKFKDLDYFVKMPVFITVAGLTSMHVSDGSANVMVVKSPKTYTFNGLGVNVNDKVYWGSVCDGSVEDQKHAEVLLDENRSATFYFDEMIQGPVVLCYKHGNEPYHEYPSFSLTVKEIQGMTTVSTTDTDDLAIVDQPKTVQFTGVGISSEYNDVVRWVRGDSCDSDVVPLMSSMTVETNMLSYSVDEEEAERYKMITSRADRLKNALKNADASAHSVSVDVNGRATFSFAMDSSEQSDEHFYLCYKFGEEPFHLYKDIRMRVFDLYDARSYSTDDKIDDKYLIAAGSMVPVEFTGYGVSVGDRAYWVKGDRPCRPKNALPISSDHLYSENMVSVDSVQHTSVMFTQGYEELVSLCYQFGNEEPKRYDFPFRIARVNAIHNADETQSFVTYVDSEARFYGFNLGMSSTSDRFSLTSGNDCSSDLVSMVDLTTGQTGTVASIDADGKAHIRFLRGGNFSLCMIFGNEATVHYKDVTIISHSVEEIIPWWTREEVEMGYSMSRVAVKGVMKKWNVQGAFEEGDLLSFAMNGNCSGTLARLRIPSSTQDVQELPILYDMERARYYFDVAFVNGSDIFKMPFTVCYRSRSDLLFYPTLMKIEVLTVETISADVGSSTAAVVGNAKNLKFASEQNYGVQAEDKIGFSKVEDCSVLEGNAIVVDEKLDAAILFEEGATRYYYLCYQFQGQPWYHVSEMRVYNVLGMNATCTDCSNDISVMYIEKSFKFIVNGDHEEGVEEYAKWVYGDEGCDGKTALLSQVSAPEVRDYSGDLVEIEKSRSELATRVSELMDESVESLNALRVTGSSTAMTFLQSSYVGVDNKFSLCYKFGQEPFKLYSDIQMTVVGIDSITSNKGLYSTLVAGVPETWTISGFGFTDQDMLKLVRGAECSSEAVVETAVYGSNPIEAYVTDLMVPTAEEGALTVCWKFENEEYAFMTKYAISVYDITSASRVFAVEGVPSVFSYTGIEVKEGDFVRYTTGDDCDSEYATFNGIPDKKVDGDHSVELSFDYASMKDYKLCYKFDEEPYKLYDIPVEVATVNGLYYGGQEYQSISLSLSEDYRLSIMGINLHAGDRVQFVPESYTSCDMMEENDPPVFETPAVTEEDIDKERVSFTVSNGMSGVYKLCYAYKSEPEVFHPYFDVTLVFQGVSSITSDYGDNFFLVVGHTKTFAVNTTYGTGSGDRVALTAGLTCDEENLIALNEAGDKTLTVDATGRFSMTLQESSASAAIMNHNASCFAMCYSYDNSPDTVLMKRFCYTVGSLDAVTTQTIQGQTKNVQVSGYMMREGDSYGWTETSATSCEEMERLPFYHSKNGEKFHSTVKSATFYPVPATGYIEEDGTELFNLFSSFKDANSFAVVDAVNLETNEVTIHTALDGVKGIPSTARICYKFANEPTYPFDVVLNVVAAVDVQPRIFANHQEASLEVSLSAAVEGAKVKFVGAGEVCDSLNILTVGGESELAAGTVISGEIALTGEAASEYMVCLRLAEGEYHAYPEMTVRVIDFQLEPVSFVVADFSTSLTVTAASGLTMQDKCYFTTNSVCDGSSIVEIDGMTFTPMSGSVSVAFMDSAKNVNLCYVTEGLNPVLLQTNVITEVAQLLYIEGLNMHYAMLPYNVEKQLRLYGSGLITGEFWLSKIDSDCSDVEGRLSLVNNDQNSVIVGEHQNNEFMIQPLSQSDEYHLCYSYSASEVKRYSKYLFYPISVTSIVAREVGDDGLAVVGAEKVFNIAGSHLTVDDYLGWSRSEDCTEMVPIEEEDGVYTPLLMDPMGQLYFKVTFKDNSDSAPDHQFFYCFNSHLNGNLPVPFRMTVYEMTKTQWSQGSAEYNEESATFLNEAGEHMSVKGFDLEKGKAHYEVKFTAQGSDEVLEVVGATSGTGDRLPAFTTLPEVDNENKIADSEKIDGLRSRLQEAQDVGTVVSVNEDPLVEGFGSATKEVRFMEGLSSDVMIEPHFKFGYEDFARSEKGAFKLYHIDDLCGVEGSAHDVVVGVSKEFQFVGYEVTAGDKFWFVQPSMSCEDTTVYATIVYKGVTARQAVTVAAEDSTFELTFLDAVPELALCYQFHNRADHVLVPGVTLTMHTINSITPTIATYNKWTTVDFSDSIGVSSGDRVRWVSSSQTDCTQNIVASDVMEESMTHAFFFSRLDGSITTVSLCYQFGEESWTMYPSLTIQLREILSITPQDAVRDLPRTITVEGSAMESTDRFAFVSVTEHCSNLDLNAGEQATALSSRVVSFVWTFTGEETLYKFCYMTDSTWTEYDDQGFLVDVYSVSAMPATTEGADTILVKSIMKSFTVEGHGVDRVGNRAFFVPSTAEDCSGMNYDITVVSEGNSTYRLATEKTSGSYALCYQFFGFPTVMYKDIVKDVISFTAITTTVGDVAIAVKDMTKPYGVQVESVSLSGSDRMWFSAEGTDCAEPVQLVSEDGTEMTEVDFTNAPTTVSRVFGFKTAGSVEVCYKFFEEHVLATGMLISVKEVTAVTPDYVYDNVPSAMVYSGVGIANGDVARWILHGETCTSTNASVGSVSDFISIHTITPVTAEGEFYELCYEFKNSAQTKHYTGITMTVKPTDIEDVTVGCKKYVEWGVTVDTTVAPQTVRMAYTREDSSVLSFTLNKDYTQTEMAQNMPSFGAVRVTYVSASATEGTYLFVFLDDECSDASMESSCTLVLSEFAAGVTVERKRLINECQAATDVPKTVIVSGSVGSNDRMAFVDSEEMCTKERLMEDSTSVSNCAVASRQCSAQMTFTENTHKDFTFSLSCTANEAYSTIEGLLVALRLDKQLSALYSHGNYTSFTRSRVMKEVSSVTIADLEVMASEFVGVKSAEVVSTHPSFCPTTVGETYTHTIVLHGIYDQFPAGSQPVDVVFYESSNSNYVETTSTKFTMASVVSSYGARTKSLCYMFNESIVKFYPNTVMEVYDLGYPVVGTENESTGGLYHSTGSDFTISFDAVSDRCKPESVMSFEISNRPSIGGHFMYLSNFHRLLTDTEVDTTATLGPGEEAWMMPDFMKCVKINKVYWLPRGETNRRVQSIESQSSNSLKGPWSPSKTMDIVSESLNGFYGLDAKGRFMKMHFHKSVTNEFYVISDPAFVGQNCDYDSSTDIKPLVSLVCSNPSKCGSFTTTMTLGTCSRSAVISGLPFGEYSMRYKVSEEDEWTTIPNYNGSVDVTMLSAIQPERVVAGESAVVTLTLSSGSVAQNGDRIRFVKNPAGFTSENPCVEYGYPLPETMTISFVAVTGGSSEQHEAVTNGNDFTSLLAAGDKVIVVDRDGAEKKSYKMTISSVTADRIVFVEFLNEIESSKEFMLQLFNEYELEVVDGVTRTTQPVGFKTSNSDVTVCYVRKPVESNVWYSRNNGFHAVAVETLGVEGVQDPAKTIMVVKDQPVTIQFRGVGLRYADRAYFVEAGTECNASTDMELNASETFTYGVFTFEEAKEYELCYMYLSTVATGDEHVYHKVPTVRVAVHTVTAAASVDKGTLTGFVADYEKEITFTLVEFVSSVNTFYAVPATATVCSPEEAVGMNVTALSSTTFKVSFLTVGLTVGQPLQLCFVFGNYPAQLYPSITFTVSELYGLTGNLVDQNGFVDQAVANGEKPLNLYGMQLATGDYIKFINNDEECDSNTGFGRRLPEVLQPEDDPQASIVTCPDNSNLCSSTLRFSRESRDNVHACYWFSKDPGYWKSYPYSLRITLPGELSFTSVDNMDDRGLVAGQSKRFQIRGNGATYEDTVYLVRGSASCVAANALDGRVFKTSVMEINNAFAVVVDLEYVTAGDDFGLCYQFSTLSAFNDKVTGRFHVSAITGIDATLTSGSSTIAIAGHTKMFYFSGSGLVIGDMAGWATDDEECGVSHITSVLEQNGSFYAPSAFSTEDAGKTFSLCYKFVNENWMRYNATQVTVKQYYGPDSVSQGAANVIVMNTPKVYYLTDADGSYGYSTNDEVHLVLDANECQNASAYVYTAPVVARSRSGSQFQYTLDLPSSLAGKTCYVCYAFDNETPFATGDSIRVKHMPGFVGVFEGTSVDVEQSLNTAVLNVEKRLVFPSGNNIDSSDRFAFVSSAEECESLTEFSNIISQQSTLYVSVLYTDLTDVNTQFFGCMKFGSEPALYLPSITMVVKSFTDMYAVEGANNVVVLSVPKEFVIESEGGAQGDSVIVASSSCTDVNAANRMIFPVVSNGTHLLTTITINTEDAVSATNSNWFFCYKFVSEKPAETSVRLSILGFTSVDGVSVDAGDKLKIIVKREKVYSFSAAQGAAENDQVALGCSCETLLSPVVSLDASLTASLMLTSTPSCTVGLCYYFSTESPVFYSWPFTTYELTSVNDQTEVTLDLITGVTTSLTFAGASSVNDQFKFVPVSQPCVSTLNDYSDGFGDVLPNTFVEQVLETEDGTATVVKLNDESDVTVYFKSMHSSVVDGVTVGLTPFIIGGHYVYVSDYKVDTHRMTLTSKVDVKVNDVVKMVHATLMTVSTSTNVYKGDVTLPMTSGAVDQLKLCYAFAGDAFFAYDAFKVNVHEVVPTQTRVSGSVSRVMMENMDNELVFTGVNMKTGDVLKLVDVTKECSDEAAVESSVTCTEETCSTVITTEKTGSFKFCYMFTDIGVQSSTYSMDIIGAYVVSQSSEQNVWFSVANQPHVISYNTTKASVFMQTRVPRYVEMNNNGFIVTGLLDNMLQESGEVILMSASTANAEFRFTLDHLTSILPAIELFSVQVQVKQWGTATWTVIVYAGETALMTRSTSVSADGKYTFDFNSLTTGWDVTALQAGELSYSIRVTTSSTAICTLVQTWSEATFSMDAVESFKYVQTSCADEAVASVVLNSESTVSWMFSQGYNDMLKLCYSIGGSSFVDCGMGYRMRVGEITSVESLVGAPNRVVIGIPKTFVLEGSWIQENDEVFYNVNTVSTETLLVSENGTFTLSLTEPTTTEPMMMNYRFNTMPVKTYPFSITQVYVSSVTMSGEAGHAVVGKLMTAVINGNGFTSADSMWFVESSEDCEEETTLATVTMNMISTSVQNAQFMFSAAAAGKSVKLCYSFDMEGAVAVTEPLSVMDFSSVTVSGEGNVNMAVANQEKTMVLMGDGLRAGDAVSFHTTADCSSAAVASFPVMSENGVFTTTYLFTAGSNGVSYTFCYHYGTNTENVVAYPSFNVVVKAFTAFLDTMQETNISFFVAHNEKPVRVTADGFATGDMLAFTAGESCSGLLSLEVNGEMATSITLQGQMTSVKVMEEVASGEIYVCYKFGSEEFVRVPTAYVLYSLTVTADEGMDVSSAVAGQSKTFYFQRSHVNAGDYFYFVPESATPTATGCPSNEMITEIGYVYIGTQTSVNLTINTPSNGEKYQLCYVFAGEESQLLGSNGAFQPAKWDLMIKGVTSFESGSVVAKQYTEVPAVISGASEDDSAWFTEGSDCSTVVTADVVTNATFIAVSFDATTSTAVKLCYKFAGNQVFLYEDYTLTVKELVMMSATSGNDTIAIWLRPKTLIFSGVGVAAGDKIKFVPSGCGCDEEVDFMKDPNDVSQSVSFYTLNEELEAETFFAEESTEEAPYQLCYQFAGHDWMHYGPEGEYGVSSPFYLIVFGRPEVSPSAGAKDVFVKGVPKTLMYSGVLITAQDIIKVVEGTNCNSSAVAAVFDNMVLGESHTLTFSFDEDVYTTMTLTMCFRFAEDDLFVSLYPIYVKTLTSAVFASGHSQVLVARQSKVVELAGVGLSTDDVVMFTYTNCENAEFAFPVNATETAFESTVVMEVPTTQSSLYLCYVFGSEPGMLYNMLSFSVKGVTGAEVVDHPEYPVNVFVQTESSTVAFTGFGLSANDDVMFVTAGSSCSSVNAIRTQKLSTDYRIQYQFTETETEQEYDVCYIFTTGTVSEAPIKYEEYSFTVRSVPTVRSVVPALSNNGAVVNQEKEFVVEGSALAGMGDMVVLVEGVDCSGEVQYEMPVSTEKTFNVTLFEVSESALQMCYVFVGLDRRFALGAFTTKQVLSFASLNGNNTKVTANIPRSYRIEAFGAGVGDMAKMVTGDNCDAGQWIEVIDGIVQFSLDFASEPYKLCYQFVGEEPMMYEDMVVMVMSVNQLIVDDGARNDAILFHEDNEITITGMVFPGDRIFPLPDPLNGGELTSEDCLNSVTLDDYLEKDADGKFHVSVVTGGSIVICYLFEGETIPFLTQFNLTILGVSNAEVVSNGVSLGSSYELWAVRNVTADLRLISTDTVHESRYKWVDAEATDCATAPAMGMEDADEGVAMEWDGVEYMHHEFSFTDVSTADWKLCYKFSGKRWMIMSDQSYGATYMPIRMESRGLLSITDVDGSSEVSEIIPHVPKVWSVNVANPTPTDKMRLVSGISCTDRHQIVAEESVEGYLVTWTLNTDLPQLNVCFGFGNGQENFWVLYEEWPVEVLYVSSVMVPGNKNLLYVDSPKEYTFFGSNVDRVDAAYLVPTSSVCSNSSAVAWSPVSNAKAVLMVQEAVEETLMLCVHFEGQDDVSVTPDNEPILLVTVVEVNALESLDGYSGSSAVVSQSKNFRLLGSHPELVSNVIFTTSTCDSVFKEFAVTNGAFVGIFDQHSEGVDLNVCVKCVGEEPVDTGISMSLKALFPVSVNKGDSRVLVWGTEKTFRFQGYGINSEEDTAEFVIATSVNQDEE